MEAFRAPNFHANILTVGLLTPFFNTLFTEYLPSRENVSTYVIYRRRSTTIIRIVEKSADGLYRFPVQENKFAHSAIEFQKSSSAG